MNITIIKYNAGNIQSVLFALERIGATAIVTDSEEEIRKSDKVIFPGVGEASSAMRYLRQRNLDQVIATLKQPVLGICLGMQLLCNHSEEGDTACLGVFDTNVKQFKHDLKIPQIGWNDVRKTDSPLFNGLPDSFYCYFVHSFYAEKCPDTIASTEYGIEFSSALARDNFYGVQYHTEKSATAGETVIKNFLAL